MNATLALALSVATISAEPRPLHAKSCASCGREMRFYTSSAAMEPATPPDEDVTCSACDARAIVRPLGCVARSL